MHLSGNRDPQVFVPTLKLAAMSQPFASRLVMSAASFSRAPAPTALKLPVSASLPQDLLRQHQSREICRVNAQVPRSCPEKILYFPFGKLSVEPQPPNKKLDVQFPGCRAAQPTRRFRSSKGPSSPPIAQMSRWITRQMARPFFCWLLERHNGLSGDFLPQVALDRPLRVETAVSKQQEATHK
jgi:hypothetical protein